MDRAISVLKTGLSIKSILFWSVKNKVDGKQEKGEIRSVKKAATRKRVEES